VCRGTPVGNHCSRVSRLFEWNQNSTRADFDNNNHDHNFKNNYNDVDIDNQLVFFNIQLVSETVG